MQQIQLIQISPEELSNLISEAVTQAIQTLSTELQIAISKPHEKEVMTRIEVAKFLCVSLVAIHDWTNKGILKQYKLGRRVYFNRSEIMQTLYDSNRRKI